MTDLQRTTRPMDRRQEVAIFRGVPAPQLVPDPIPGGTAELAQFRLTAFGGIAHTAKGALRAGISLRTLPQWSLADMIGEAGEWWGVFRHEQRPDEYVVATDAYNYGYVPYAWYPNDGGTLYTANGFQAVMGALLDEGHRPEVNWPLVSAHLSTSNAFYNQFTADETFAKGVSTLRPGRLLHITPQGSFLRHRDLFTGDYTAGDYDRLLDDGIERAVAQLQALARTDVEDRRIYLSGGRDSRMVMALLAAAGVSEHFTICSANPRTWPGDAYSRKVVKADFDVANTIRKKFGMHWSADGEFAGHDATFEETLQYWQSFRSNQSFAYTARREQFFPLATRMEVRGAGGEAYRDFWSAKIPKLPWYPELKHGPDNFHADVETAFANMVPRQVLRPQEWEAAFESYRDTLASLTTEGFDEAVDMHFTAFRQRAHFGHGMQTLSRNGMVVFPPSQPEWVVAGQFLSQAERKSGLICFEVIERTCPELNEIPFDSDQWTDELWARRPGGRPVLADVPDAEFDCDDYWEIEQAGFNNRHNPTPVPRADGRPVAHWGLAGAGRPRARFDIETLRTAPGGQALTPELQAFIAKRISLSDGALGMTLGKLESAIDVVVHRRRPSDAVEFRVGGGEQLPPQFGWNVNGGRAGVSAEVADVKIPPSELLRHSVSVAAKDSGLSVRVDASYPLPGELEYAYYVYRGTTVVHKQMYGPSRTALLPLDEAGTYTVRSFIHVRQTPHLVFSRDSAKVEWAPSPLLSDAASTRTAEARRVVAGRVPEPLRPAARTAYRTARRLVRRAARHLR